MNKGKIIWTSSLLLGGLLLGAALSRITAEGTGAPVGIFESHGDVGTVLHAGSVHYDVSRSSYTVSGSGENMWLAADAFQFVWKKVSGDVTLTADVSFVGTGGNAHRKAVLMIRQSLDADSVYADLALHGNGLTSLQSRDEKGGITREIQAITTAPDRLRIVKRGAYVYMFVGRKGDPPQMAGGSMRVSLQEPFYVGIGVCAHDKDVTETAVFSNVDLQRTAPVTAAKPVLYSTLEIVPAASGDRRVVYVAPERIEAPNWTHDGAWLLFNRNGLIERIPMAGGKPEMIDTGFAASCNNDHGISPDGTSLAISDQSQEPHQSIIYIVPLLTAFGGAPRRITQKSPSYWHGWSPDGRTIAFCGERQGKFDIYTIPVSGGEETQLTTGTGHNDGPEYSPDAQYIYFNSDRTGLMQIWRMRPDGSKQEQVTFDDFNNWFPHVSPDGLQMAYLSYAKDVTGHPENKDVMIRVMSLSDLKSRVLAKLFGGQGTMNVPSWSPDSKQLAFVSFQLLP